MQITGDMSGNGTVYIAGMDEGGGGFPHNDENLIFKSTEAAPLGLTPTPAHPSRDRVLLCWVTSPGYLPTQRWLLAARGLGRTRSVNNVVHLVYAQHGAGSDPGDVYYIRSTDGGGTLGAP